MLRKRWLIASGLLLLIAMAALAPFTAVGTRSVVAIANLMPGLTLVHRSGVLFGAFELASVTYDNDVVSVTVEDIAAQLETGCLWESRVCIEGLAIARLEVAVQGADSDSEPGEELFSLPFGLRAPQITVASAVVSWAGGAWSGSLVTGDVGFHGTDLSVARLRVEESLLDLGEFDSNASADRTRLPRVFLPLALTVDDGRLMSLVATANGDSLHVEQLLVSGVWRGLALSLDELMLGHREYGEATLAGSVTFSDEWPVNVTAGADIPALDLLPEWLHGQAATADARGALGALEWSLAISGGALIGATGEVDVLAPGLAFSALAELAWEDGESLAAVFTLPPMLAALEPRSPVSLAISGDLAAQSVELSAAASGINYPDLQAQVNGEHSEGVFTLDRLELTEPGTSSSLIVRGQLMLRDAIEWRFALESDGLTLPGISQYLSGRVEGTANVSGGFTQGGWQSRLTDVALSGILNQLPVTVRGDLGLSSDQLLLDGDFEASLNGADLQLRQSPGERGELSLTVDDIGRWLPGSEGALSVGAFIAEGGESLRLDGRANRFLWGSVTSSEIQLSGDLELGNNYSFDLLAQSQGSSLGRLNSDDLSLKLSGSTREVQGVLAASGDIEGKVSLDAAPVQGVWQGRVSTAGIATPAGRWTLSTPIVWEQSGQLSVSAHCWQSGQSAVCLNPSLFGEQSSVSLDLDVQLALVEFLLPAQLSMSGKLVGQASAKWESGESASAEVTAEAGQVVLVQQLAEGEVAEFNVDRIDLLLNHGDQGSQLSGSMLRGESEVAAADLRFTPGAGDAIEGSLRFDDLRLAALRPFAPQLSQLSGKLDGNLRVSGTVQRPLLNGSAAVSDSYLSVVGNPNALDALSLTIAFAGERATLQGQARLGGGPAVVTGTAHWDDVQRLELRLDGERNRLLVPPYSELLVSSGFDVLITPTLAEVTGQVTVHEGRLEHEQLPAGSVAVSDDIVEVDYAGNVLRDRVPFNIRSSVRVIIEDRFRVVGTNIDATVGGDLRLEQDPERPMQVFGTLNVIGGEVRAYGQRLTVSQGFIDFSGDPDNPQLNLRAERDIPRERMLVGVTVTGSLEEPLLAIYSEPDMSQTAALSWLVRGRGPDAGAGADGTAMAIAMGAGVINQTGVVSEINRIPGISNVEFGAEGVEDDTAATVSGYIGERIFISYGVGIYEPINVLAARLYLQARLWLEVVSRLENSLDLYYSFDID